jgi:hypothetical protein
LWNIHYRLPAFSSRCFILSRNLFDAFGCAEFFVCEQTREIDRRLQPRRTQAVDPIRKRLLKICDESAREAQTFTEARRRIVLCMKSKSVAENGVKTSGRVQGNALNDCASRLVHHKTDKPPARI